MCKIQVKKYLWHDRHKAAFRVKKKEILNKTNSTRRVYEVKNEYICED